MSEPVAPEPDDKDWTWVLDRPCPECGFSTATFDRDTMPELFVEIAVAWGAVLRQDDVRERPAPAVWSALEYACHVRDVCDVMSDRAEQIRAVDNPTFANWDQDATAIERRYWAEKPNLVSHAIADATARAAEAFGDVEDAEWTRPGLRSNGSEFTLETLGAYFVHDVIHHLHDVGSPLPSQAS